MINTVLLGLDYGEKKIGLAIKPKGMYKSQPLDALNTQGDIPLKILSVCKQHHIEMVILGLPLNGMGHETYLSKKTRKFHSILQVSLPKTVPIELVNERYTTKQAWLLYQQDEKKRKAWNLYKDSMAAVMILEKWMVQYYEQPYSVRAVEDF